MPQHLQDRTGIARGGSGGWLAKLLWLTPPALLCLAVVGLELYTNTLDPGHRHPPALWRGIEIALGSALWLASAWLLSRALEIFFWRGLVRRLLGHAAPRLLHQSLVIVVYAVAVTGIVAYVLNQPVAGIWETSGVITIVLGLAVRGIIGDIFTGLAFNMDQGFRIGDWVEVADKNYPGLFGQIREVHWRATRIRTVDEREIIVPNNTLGQMVVVNYSVPSPACRFEFPVTLDTRVPTERATAVLRAGVLAAANSGRILEVPAPDILVAGAHGSGVEYLVRYWVRVGETAPAVGRDIVARCVLRHLALAGLHPVDSVKQELLLRRRAVGEDPEREVRRLLLSSVELFGAGLTQDEMERLAGRARRCTWMAGQIVVREGEPGRSLFVIAEGLAEVTIAHDAGSLRLAQLDAGACFGEMSLLTGAPRSATVTARTALAAYEITDADLTPLLAQRPELVEALSRLAAERRLAQRDGGPRDATDEAAETAGLSQQIMGRMSAFFRHLGQKRGSA